MNNTSYDIIRLRNAVFYAYHGVMKDEQNLGGKFEVDAELYCHLTNVRKSDNLNDTVNYEQVYTIISSVISQKKYYLIEALADAIAKKIIEQFFLVEKVCIRIRKLSVPIHGVVDSVEVEIIEERHK